jgi:hypothetical protein
MNSFTLPFQGPHKFPIKLVCEQLENSIGLNAGMSKQDLNSNNN